MGSVCVLLPSRKDIPRFRWNLLCLGWCLSSGGIIEESASCFFTSCREIFVGESENNPIFWPFLVWEVLQCLIYLCGPVLDLLQFIQVCLVMGSSKRGSALPVWPHGGIFSLNLQCSLSRYPDHRLSLTVLHFRPRSAMALRVIVPCQSEVTGWCWNASCSLSAGPARSLRWGGKDPQGTAQIWCRLSKGWETWFWIPG